MEKEEIQNSTSADQNQDTVKENEKPEENLAEENKQEIINNIEDKIKKITILKFRSGKPNSTVFPTPMKEIEKIKDSVIQDIKNRVLDFFETTNNEFEKLSQMECLETEDCCAKTIKQVNSIINFTDSKNMTFNKIISELKEYNEHLAPLLHMELLSKKDKDKLKEIQIFWIIKLPGSPNQNICINVRLVGGDNKFVFFLFDRTYFHTGSNWKFIVISNRL